jgi:hypothetical protein
MYRQQQRNTRLSDYLSMLKVQDSSHLHKRRLTALVKLLSAGLAYTKLTWMRIKE